jgi:hypothetical protein
MACTSAWARLIGIVPQKLKGQEAGHSDQAALASTLYHTRVRPAELLILPSV